MAVISRHPRTLRGNARAASAPRASKESEKPTRNDGQKSEPRKLKRLPFNESRTIGKRLPLSGQRLLVTRPEELGLPRNASCRIWLFRSSSELSLLCG